MTPFSSGTNQTIAVLGEVGLIAQIKSWLHDTTAPAPRGIGDDCAVLPAQPLPGQRLVTTDSVMWARHFDETVPPRAVGEKLIKRNLSDIAAMGGQPSDAVLSLILGPNVATCWLEEFFAGVAASCRQYRVELAGGDIVGAVDGFFCATLTLTGFAKKPLPRLNAREGDTLLVTGTLGGSLLGKHFQFLPRLDEGRWLASHPAVRAGMDITDGLAKDIPALLPDGTSAQLNLDKIPIDEAARHMSALDQLSPLAHAIDDGEDYELLIVAETTGVPALLADWQKQFPALPLSVIGAVAPEKNPAHTGKLIDRATGKALGQEHHGYLHF